MVENDKVLNKEGLNIVHLNVASMLGAHKFEMLRKQVEGSHISVFCASETWLNEGIPDRLIAIKGYNQARRDRDWKNSESDRGPKKEVG